MLLSNIFLSSLYRFNVLLGSLYAVSPFFMISFTFCSVFCDLQPFGPVKCLELFESPCLYAVCNSSMS